MNSPLRWFGGKHYLLKYIFPLPDHKLYSEIFGGGASLLFAKPPSYREVYNDINGRLVNFWLQLQTHPDELQVLCGKFGWLDSRELFYQYMEVAEDPLEDAMRFYYVNRHSFSGLNLTFHGIAWEDYFDGHQAYMSQVRQLPAYAKRIEHVVIEHQDFRSLIPRLNHPDTLLYIDPPYIQGGKNYEKGIGGHPWTDQDLTELLDMCRSFEGKIIFSFDDPTVLDGWHVQTITRQNCAASRCDGDERSVDNEYIITNYDPRITQTFRDPSQHSLNAFIKVSKKSEG